MNRIITYCFVFLHCISSAQSSYTKILSLDTFIAIVKKYHPVAQQANLLLKQGDASVLSTKGNLDPKINSDLNQKYFNEQQYFSLINAGLTIPTWIGVDIKAAYENNMGYYLNPENTTPQSGLWQAGISVPIGQGLFIDQRRAAIKQAELYKTATESERLLILNQLIYDAGSAYWNWFISYNTLLIMQDAYNITLQRFNATKASAKLGDRPYVDTLEANIQLQERFISLEQAKLDYSNSTLALSTYLWFQNNIPLEIKPGTIPETYMFITTTEIVPDLLQSSQDSVTANHPQLMLYNLKIEQLKIEQRWKKEQLKPVFNINYNALNYSTGDAFSNNYNLNNYKWGATISMPLLLRKERGGLQLTKLKITETTLDMQDKSYEIYNKVKAATNEYFTLQNQIKTYRQTVVNYESLLAAENKMFNTGESSVFLVNARENSAINAKIKLVDLIAKNKKTLLTINYSLGRLGL